MQRSYIKLYKNTNFKYMNLREKLEQIAALKNSIQQRILQEGIDVLNDDERYINLILSIQGEQPGTNEPTTNEPDNDNEVLIWFDTEEDAMVFRMAADGLQTKYFDSNLRYNKQERTLRFVVKEDENHFEEIKLVPADGDGSAGDDAIISFNGRNNTWGYGNGDIATFFINDYGITRIDFYSEYDTLLGSINLPQ